MSILRVRLFSSRRHLRTAELNERPATPPPQARASPRAGAPWIIRTEPSRKLQTLAWPPHTPATPEAQVFAGYWPGSGRVVAHRTSFSRRHLQAPHPPEYPETSPPAGEPFSAFDNSSWHAQAKKWFEVASYLQSVHLGVYKETPASLYTGTYPAGFAAQKAHRVWFDRKHLTVPHPEDASVTPTTEAVIPAFFAPKQHSRHEKRTIQHLPRLDTFELTIQSAAAYAPVKTIKRRDTARILRLVPQLDERPQTPPVAEQPPTAFLAPITFRRHGRFAIVDVPRFPDRRINLFPSDVSAAVNHVWYWDRFKRA